jgi:hypothetical protein
MKRTLLILVVVLGLSARAGDKKVDMRRSTAASSS